MNEPPPGYGTTADGHRATLARCRCGLPLDGEGWLPETDTEPRGHVRVVVPLGMPCSLLRHERRDALWFPFGRYAPEDRPDACQWAEIGRCWAGRGHRVVDATLLVHAHRAPRKG